MTILTDTYSRFKDELDNFIKFEKSYEIRLNPTCDRDIIEGLCQPFSSGKATENPDLVPPTRCLIDAGNKYRQKILDSVLHYQWNRPYGEIIYDYLRLSADEDLFVQALIQKRAKLIAICLLRVPITKRLKANCPRDLVYLLEAQE